MDWFKKRQQRFLILISLAGLLFTLDLFGAFQPWRDSFQAFLAPIKRPFYLFKTTNTFNLFDQSNQGQQDQVHILQQENTQLKADLLELAKIRKENRRLRRLLEAPLPPDYSYRPAYVIESNDHYLWITKGKKEGVFVGQLVIIGGQLVGEVVEVRERQAKVLSLLNRQFRKPVVIFSPQKSCLVEADSCRLGQGVLEGGWVKKILRDESVQAGDWVGLLAGPRGILVGEVTQVSLSRDKVFQQAQIEPSLDIKRPQEVFLVYSDG